LLEGKVGLFMDGKESSSHEGAPGKAITFGQRSLMQKQKQEGTLKVTSASAKVLYMDKTTFDMMLGSVDALMNDTAPSLEKSYRETITKISQKKQSVQGGAPTGGAAATQSLHVADMVMMPVLAPSATKMSLQAQKKREREWNRG
jgi:hypothetical protein